MSHPQPSLKTLAIRKELLVAEAEVLRSQMGQDLEVIRQGLTAWEDRAKSVASYASIAATALAGVSEFRRARKTELERKPSLFSKLLAGARMAFVVWGALRSRQR